MLDLHNYSPRDVRRIALTALLCAAGLLIITAWLFYIVYETGETAPPKSWQDFWLPVITNIVSSMLCVVVGFWLFFRSTEQANDNAETQIIIKQLAEIQASLKSLKEARQQPDEAKLSFAEVLAILEAFTKNNKAHGNAMKQYQKNHLNAQNNLVTSILANTSNERNTPNK